MKPASVCFALEQEAAPFRNLVVAAPGVSVLITGIGRKNAEQAIRGFLEKNSPRKVFTCGFAGGLNPALEVGDVVYATNDEMLAGSLATAGVTAVKFFCAASIATTTAEKQRIREETNADAVEMESAAIQAICREHGIPCATVRVISDTANEDLPLDFNQLANTDLSLNYGKLAWAILKSPGKITALRRLQQHTRLAAEKLAAVLQQVL